jgi:hypothetical protein
MMITNTPTMTPIIPRFISPPSGSRADQRYGPGLATDPHSSRAGAYGRGCMSRT